MQYEIRARSFGEILDTGFRVLRDHFALLIGVGAVFYLPITLLGVSIENAAANGSPGLGLATMAVGFGVVAVIVSPIVGAAITFAVGEVFLGRTVTVAASLRRAVSIIVPLLGTALLAGIFTALGFVVLVIPGIYLMLSFLLLWQVGVLEQRFGMLGIRRSRELMRGNLLRGAGVLILAALMVGVLGGVLQLVLGFIPYLGALAVGLARAVTAAYTSAVSVILYFDIRCRREAFDIEHLAQQVLAASPPAGVLLDPS
jgi:hypothetical protein